MVINDDNSEYNNIISITVTGIDEALAYAPFTSDVDSLSFNF